MVRTHFTDKGRILAGLANAGHLVGACLLGAPTCPQGSRSRRTCSSVDTWLPSDLGALCTSGSRAPYSHVAPHTS